MTVHHETVLDSNSYLQTAGSYAVLRRSRTVCEKVCLHFDFDSRSRHHAEADLEVPSVLVGHSNHLGSLGFHLVVHSSSEAVDADYGHWVRFGVNTDPDIDYSVG